MTCARRSRCSLPWAIAGTARAGRRRAGIAEAGRIDGFAAGAAGADRRSSSAEPSSPARRHRRHSGARRRCAVVSISCGPTMGRRCAAFDYGRRVRLNERQTARDDRRSTCRDAAGELTDDPRRFAGPFDLPAGRFTARIAFDGGRRRAMSGVSILLGDRMQIARGRGRATRSPLAFELPVDAPVWVAVTDPARRSAVRQVDIVAESIVPEARAAAGRRACDRGDRRAARRLHRLRRRRHLPGRRRVLDAGHRRRHGVRRSTAGASTLVLTLHVGPAGGVVRVTVDGQDRSVTLSPDQTQQIEIPLAPGGSPRAGRRSRRRDAFGRPITIPDPPIGGGSACQVRVDLR